MAHRVGDVRVVAHDDDPDDCHGERPRQRPNQWSPGRVQGPDDHAPDDDTEEQEPALLGVDHEHCARHQRCRGQGTTRRIARPHHRDQDRRQQQRAEDPIDHVGPELGGDDRADGRGDRERRGGESAQPHPGEAAERDEPPGDGERPRQQLGGLEAAGDIGERGLDDPRTLRVRVGAHESIRRRGSQLVVPEGVPTLLEYPDARRVVVGSVDRRVGHGMGQHCEAAEHRRRREQGRTRANRGTPRARRPPHATEVGGLRDPRRHDDPAAEAHVEEVADQPGEEHRAEQHQDRSADRQRRVALGGPFRGRRSDLRARRGATERHREEPTDPRSGRGGEEWAGGRQDWRS